MKSRRCRSAMAFFLAVAAILSLALSGCGKLGGTSGGILNTRSAGTLLGEDGTAYLLSDKGTVTEVKGETEFATSSRDGKYMVLEDADGKLSVVNEKGEETVIESEGASWEAVRSTGLFYTIETETTVEWTIEEIIENLLMDGNYTDTVDEAIDIMVEWGYDNSVEGAKEFYEYLLDDAYDDVYDTVILEYTYYRYIFATGAKLELGVLTNILVNPDNLSAVFTDADNAISRLAENSESVEKITNTDAELEVVLGGISPDGNIGFWMEENYDLDTSETFYTVCCFEGDDYEKVIKDYETGYMSIYCYFSEDSQKGVCVPYNGEQLLLKTAGAECSSVKLGNTVSDVTAYSDQDNLFDDVSGKWDNLYVLVDNDEYSNLYNITWAGERTKLLSNISEVVVKQGNAYYIDEDGSLYSTRLNGAEAEEPVKVASDVYSFRPSASGQTVFYMRNYDSEEQTGALYYMKHGAEEAVKISNDAYDYYVVCADGNSVLYYEDITWNEDTYTAYGALKRYTAGKGDGETVSIQNDVLTSYIRDNYYSYDGKFVDADGFYFVQYDYTSSDGTQYGVLYYYNGKETVKLAGDIVCY